MTLPSLHQTDFPLPMQYLGSKQRISPWILDQISDHFPERRVFVDLMSGSGAIAHEANLRGFEIVANDIQPYSYSVLKSAFESNRDGLPELIELLESTDISDNALFRSSRAGSTSLALEDAFVADLRAGTFDWETYRDFCTSHSGDHTTSTGDFDLFSSYYQNTYFGVRQCLEIDSLRQIASTISPRDASHLVAAIISSMTFASSSTTHLAQFLKPTSYANSVHLLERRSVSIVSAVLSRLKNLSEYRLPPASRVTNLSYQAALSGLNLEGKDGIVYVDPPYFKEHYSRYYHVLDTLALYDFPNLTFNKRLNSVTIGRYREHRITSEFGLRSKVPSAFRELFTLCAQKSLDVALSYASTSLLSSDRIVAIAEECGYDSTLRTIKLRHSGQGQNSANNTVIEYLFLLTYAR